MAGAALVSGEGILSRTQVQIHIQDLALAHIQDHILSLTHTSASSITIINISASNRDASTINEMAPVPRKEDFLPDLLLVAVWFAQRSTLALRSTVADTRVTAEPNMKQRMPQWGIAFGFTDAVV